MLKTDIGFFLLIIAIVLLTKSCDAKVSCAECPGININLTEPELNTQSCAIKDGEICILTLNIDYTNITNSGVNIGASDTPVLILSTGEPQVTDNTMIWFNELRVQRVISIICFSGTSCGFDLIKKIYREKLRLFEYEAIQRKLSDTLYSSSSVGQSLTCSNQFDATVSCPDGFCRSVANGDRLGTYSNCIKTAMAPIPYGLTVSTSAVDGLNQSVVIFTCNKPLCNNKETSQTVLELLASVNIISKPIPATNNMATKILKSRQKLLIFFLIVFPICRIFSSF